MIDECCCPIRLNCVVLHTRINPKIQTQLGKNADPGKKKRDCPIVIFMLLEFKVFF